jgi:hypothetical protein
MLRVKQADDFGFFTVVTTSPLPIYYDARFFMGFRGPKAHSNRPGGLSHIRHS